MGCLPSSVKRYFDPNIGCLAKAPKEQKELQKYQVFDGKMRMLGSQTLQYLVFAQL